MEFKEDKVEEFLPFFESKRAKILSFDGCHHVEVLADYNAKNVYYTLSHWESEEYLNQYRYSDFFEDTWNHTKTLFSGKPLAYSMLKN